MSISSSLVPTSTPAYLVISPNSSSREAPFCIMIQLNTLISLITCTPETTSISLPDSLYENFIETTLKFNQEIKTCLTGGSVGQALKYIEQKLHDNSLKIREYDVSKDKITAAEIYFENSKHILEIKHYSKYKDFTHIQEAILRTKEGHKFSMCDICIPHSDVYIKSMESSTKDLSICSSEIIFSDEFNPTLKERDIKPNSDAQMSIKDQERAIFLLLNSLKKTTLSKTLENTKVAP